MTSGGSHALDMCVALLGGPGKNILMPRPGFPLYKTLCAAYGVEIRQYDLQPDRNWQADLCHMQSLVDGNTVAIIYNNPSNPCGSVYSARHIMEILDIAQRNCIPIIADEIYENMVFPGEKFVPIAALTTEVPVLSCRGTTKRFVSPLTLYIASTSLLLCLHTTSISPLYHRHITSPPALINHPYRHRFLIPGMRLGWITVHDRHDRLGQPVSTKYIVQSTMCSRAISGAHLCTFICANSSLQTHLCTLVSPYSSVHARGDNDKQSRLNQSTSRTNVYHSTRIIHRASFTVYH